MSLLTLIGTRCIYIFNRKSASFASQVEYLGHLINKEGLHPSPSTVKAVMDAPTPSNLSELRAFLGLINYYRKFIPNISTELSPLYSLLQRANQWSWGPREEQCFHKAKTLLMLPTLLVHFDPNKQLILSCNASSIGVGAVLAHQNEKWIESTYLLCLKNPVPTEKIYSQLDKEALSIIFGVTKFQQYLFRKHFTLFTDHKPLIYLFHPHRSVPQMASARIQHWYLLLGAYSYDICYTPGKDHGNADSLSRLPLPDYPKQVPVPGDVIFTLTELHKSLITAKDISTAKYSVLSSVLRCIGNGWPNFINQAELHPYFSKRNELGVESGCIFCGSRIVVPPPGRKSVLQELHEAHPSICQMKSLSRGYVWWPKIIRN